MKKFLLTTTFILITIAPFAKAQIKVNEIMASNSSTIADEYGEFDDWVEIYNASEISINIGGMYVTDNPSSLKKMANS